MEPDVVKRFKARYPDGKVIVDNKVQKTSSQNNIVLSNSTTI